MCGKKEFYIEFDENGDMTVVLNSYEQKSPELAAIFEKAIGGGAPREKTWDPKAHAKAGVHQNHRH
jgi:hypothetical protein